MDEQKVIEIIRELYQGPPDRGDTWGCAQHHTWEDFAYLLLVEGCGKTMEEFDILLSEIKNSWLSNFS